MQFCNSDPCIMDNVPAFTAKAARQKGCRFSRPSDQEIAGLRVKASATRKALVAQQSLLTSHHPSYMRMFSALSAKHELAGMKDKEGFAIWELFIKKVSRTAELASRTIQ